MNGLGRTRNIDVVVHTGENHSLLFTSEGGEKISTCYEGHRGHFVGTNPFEVVNSEWKYFADGEPKLCQVNGKNKDLSGFSRGISMWNPHCFPKVLMSGGQVKCKKLLSTQPPPNEFIVIEDRKYSATIAGKLVSFTHYLLSPSGRFSKAQIDDALANVQTEECEFQAGAGPQNLNSIDFNDCENAVGPIFAGQCALKCFVEDGMNPPNNRCDAMVLFAWLGSLEATIDELVNLSPWASELVLKCLQQYGPALPTQDSNFLMNYGDAVDSLKYQLEEYAKSQTLRFDFIKVGRVLKDLAKTVANCFDTLVVKYDCPYDDSVADTKIREIGDVLRKSNVVVAKSRKNHGSIILTFGIQPIAPAVFYDFVKVVELTDPNACGVGLATAGTADVFREETDEYDVSFKTWVNLRSRIEPVIMRDSLSDKVLPQAVYCKSLTKRGMCCKNKTKDPSMRCWRHR